MGKILVVGSLAYDSVQTPSGKADNTLGGSANFFGLSAALFTDVQVVGVVGQDYKQSDIELLKSKGIDTEGIEFEDGKTFRWAGRYEGDLNEAKTLKTELNVFENFHPKLPLNYKSSGYVFLANIDPILQEEVLDQIKSPRIVAADTMNFWINSKLSELRQVLRRVGVLLINETEAKAITGAPNAVAAAEKICEAGPQCVVIKRGEYGFILFVDGQYFALPAFPIKEVIDPTGAGDSFAGGFMGYLSKHNHAISIDAIKQAAVYGTLLASFTVQDFGVGALRKLSLAEVEKRHELFRRVVSIKV